MTENRWNQDIWLRILGFLPIRSILSVQQTSTWLRKFVENFWISRKELDFLHFCTEFAIFHNSIRRNSDKKVPLRYLKESFTGKKPPALLFLSKYCTSLQKIKFHQNLSTEHVQVFFFAPTHLGGACGYMYLPHGWNAPGACFTAFFVCALSTATRNRGGGWSSKTGFLPFRVLSDEEKSPFQKFEMDFSLHLRELWWKGNRF